MLCVCPLFYLKQSVAIKHREGRVPRADPYFEAQTKQSLEKAQKMMSKRFLPLPVRRGAVRAPAFAITARPGSGSRRQCRRCGAETR